MPKQTVKLLITRVMVALWFAHEGHVCNWHNKASLEGPRTGDCASAVRTNTLKRGSTFRHMSRPVVQLKGSHEII